MKLIFNFKWELINQLPKKLQERYLEYLSGNEDWMVRSSVARHPNTPVQTLEKLGEDEHWLVRGHVASHPNTPVHVLERLSGDSYVAQFAKENLKKRKAIDKPLE
jgi:hypothetical protein